MLDVCGRDEVGGVMGKKKSALGRVDSETDLGPGDVAGNNHL